MDSLLKSYSDEIFNLPTPAISIDIVLFTTFKGKFCMILDIKEDKDKNIKYILPGGIVRKGISIEKNFDEILKERTGLMGIYRHQFTVLGDVDRDPRGHVISISYLALISSDKFLKEADLTKVQIVEYDDLDKIRIGFHFDHLNIIKLAKTRLDNLLEYSNIVVNILPKNFTLTELHNIYESILGAKIDKRNFLKKIIYMKIIKETGKVDKLNSKKPAKLYEFVNKEFLAVDMV